MLPETRGRGPTVPIGACVRDPADLTCPPLGIPSAYRLCQCRVALCWAASRELPRTVPRVGATSPKRSKNYHPRGVLRVWGRFALLPTRLDMDHTACDRMGCNIGRGARDPKASCVWLRLCLRRISGRKNTINEKYIQTTTPVNTHSAG